MSHGINVLQWHGCAGALGSGNHSWVAGGVSLGRVPEDAVVLLVEHPLMCFLKCE